MLTEIFLGGGRRVACRHVASQRPTGIVGAEFKGNVATGIATELDSIGTVRVGMKNVLRPRKPWVSGSFGDVSIRINAAEAELGIWRILASENLRWRLNSVTANPERFAADPTNDYLLFVRSLVYRKAGFPADGARDLLR